LPALAGQAGPGHPFGAERRDGIGHRIEIFARQPIAVGHGQRLDRQAQKARRAAYPRGRGVCAFGAGLDVVLHCNGVMPEMRAVAAEAPQLAGEAARRAEAALAAKTPPQPIDVAASRTEFISLMAGVWQPAQGLA